MKVEGEGRAQLWRRKRDRERGREKARQREREIERETGREREARDGISPVCQPASLVYAPGHPPALQVAIPLRLSNERALDRLWLFVAIREHAGNVRRSRARIRTNIRRNVRRALHRDSICSGRRTLPRPTRPHSTRPSASVSATVSKSESEFDPDARELGHR